MVSIETTEKIKKKLLQEDLSVAEIAKQLWISRGSVYLVINENNLFQRKKDLKKRKKDDYIHRLTIDSVALFLREKWVWRSEMQCTLHEYRAYICEKHPLIQYDI